MKLTNKSTLKHLGLKLLLVVALALPELANAQFFNYNQYGDVLAGFRKTGTSRGSYELVVNLGSVTNFLNVTAGSTINISSFTSTNLNHAFATNNNNLQWSVFATFPGSITAWSTPLGSFPVSTLWFTVPGTNVATQTQPPARNAASTQQQQKSQMLSVGTGANTISQALITTNVDNNTVLVRESIAGYPANILTAFIGDSLDYTIGDFGAGGSPLASTVENTTPASFSAAQRSDFYQVCPSTKVDPITGSTTDAYFIGYFLLNPNGTMTFTRAAAGPAAPAAGSITSTATNGFSPLTVVFTNTASGSITNWVWNFGNGTIITNTSGVNVTNTYAAGGNFTVTLIVRGPGGSSTNVMANFIVASSTPIISSTFIGNKLVVNGTNCPAGLQYRMLTSTNLALAVTNWNPVWTNTFLSGGTFAYTNAMTNRTGYYRLVSP